MQTRVAARRLQNILGHADLDHAVAFGALPEFQQAPEATQQFKLGAAIGRVLQNAWHLVIGLRGQPPIATDFEVNLHEGATYLAWAAGAIVPRASHHSHVNYATLVLGEALHAAEASVGGDLPEPAGCLGGPVVRIRQGLPLPR